MGLRNSEGAEESTLEVDSSVHLTHHDPKGLGLICLVRKRKIYFLILGIKNPILIFLKKRTLRIRVEESIRICAKENNESNANIKTKSS